MSVFKRVNRHTVEERSTWNMLVDSQASQTYSGKRVNEESALKFSVVWSAATLITDAVAYLTPEAYTLNEEDGEVTIVPTPRWVLRPHPEIRRGDIWAQILLSVLLWGNGYAMLVRRDSDAAIIGMLPLDPRDVHCEWNPANRSQKRYHISGRPENEWLTSGDILHITGPTLPGSATGLSVIAQARESIALGLTLEEFAARYFGQGSMAKVVIKVPNALKEQQALDIVKTYERFHKGADNWHRPAVLSGGGELENISIPPEDAQFLQSREFQALDIARWFRVPPHVVGIMTKQSSWGSGLAEENMAMVQRTYRPWIRRMEDGITAYLPFGEDAGVRIRLRDDELLRGTFKEQGEAWATLVEKGIATPNEARKPLGLPPIEGGDDLIKPPEPGDFGADGGGADPKARTALRYNQNHDTKGRFSTSAALVSPGLDTYADLTPGQQQMVEENLKNYGITQDDLVREIDSRLTEEGLREAADWYPSARQFNEGLAEQYGVSIGQATAITAAISPQTRWDSEGGKYRWNNQSLAHHVLQHYNDDPSLSPVAQAKAMGGGMSTNLGMGVGIARGTLSPNDVTGVKRRSFYNNMLDPESRSVTIDTWMTQAVFNASPRFSGNASAKKDGPPFIAGAGVKAPKGTAKGDFKPGYVSLADAVREVADKRGLAPTVVQTAYWNYARSLGNAGNLGRRVE